MWELIKDVLLLFFGTGIGVVLMCIIGVRKETDRHIVERKDREKITE